MKISANVENAQHRLVAEMGDIPSPKLCSGPAVFWGSTFLVNIPVENLEDVSATQALLILLINEGIHNVPTCDLGL